MKRFIERFEAKSPSHIDVLSRSLLALPADVLSLFLRDSLADADRQVSLMSYSGG